MMIQFPVAVFFDQTKRTARNASGGKTIWFRVDFDDDTTPVYWTTADPLDNDGPAPDWWDDGRWLFDILTERDIRSFKDAAKFAPAEYEVTG